jgi:protease PrsW
VWLLFYIREDADHPEPNKLLFYTFIAGGAVTFFALGPQILLGEVLSQFAGGPYSPIGLFLLAGIEEFFKFFAAYIIVGRSKEFDEPIDAMIYMIVASLGFAAMENIASIVRGGVPLMLDGESAQILALRFIGATLLHTLSSAFVGYYWGVAKARGNSYWSLIIEGVGVATLLHAIFNGFILIYKPEQMIGTLFLVAVAFFVLNDFEELKIFCPQDDGNKQQ